MVECGSGSCFLDEQVCFIPTGSSKNFDCDRASQNAIAGSVDFAGSSGPGKPHNGVVSDLFTRFEGGRYRRRRAFDTQSCGCAGKRRVKQSTDFDFDFRIVRHPVRTRQTFVAGQILYFGEKLPGSAPLLVSHVRRPAPSRTSRAFARALFSMLRHATRRRRQV